MNARTKQKQAAHRLYRRYYRLLGAAERLVRRRLEGRRRPFQLSGWHGVVCTPVANDEAEFRKVRCLPDGGIEVEYINTHEEIAETAAFHLLEPADQIAVLAELFGINT